MKRQMKTMAMVMYLGIVLLRGAPTAALPPPPPPPDDEDPRPTEPTCLSYVEGDLTATSQTIRLGEPVTLHWNVRSLAEGCPDLVLLGGEIVHRTGSLTVVPAANTTYTLTGRAGNRTRHLASASITVVLPSVVRIFNDTPDKIRRFIEAVGTPNTLVLLAHNLELDLTGYESIHIKRGVTLTSEVPSPGNAPPPLAAALPQNLKGPDLGPVNPHSH